MKKEDQFRALRGLAEKITESGKLEKPGCLYREYFSDRKALSEFQFNEVKFPQFSRLGIRDTLKKTLPDKRLLQLYYAWHKTPSANCNPFDKNPLAAFMAAFIWKQGDWQTFNHQLKGFLGEETSGTDALVIYNFGKHLEHPLHPILDQHTFRAYLLLCFDRSWINSKCLQGFRAWSPKSANPLDKNKHSRGSPFGVLDGNVSSKDLNDTSAKGEESGFFNWRIGLLGEKQKNIKVSDQIDKLLFCFGKASKALHSRKRGGRDAHQPV